MIKILHFTDIHQTTPGETIAGRDPAANLERGLAHALENHADAAFLAITGDLSDWGDREDYVRLRTRLEALPMPAHPIIGNHDERGPFLEIFPECADASGFAQYSRDHGGYRCLFLDTHEPETHAGHYCASRQGWLEAQLASHDGPFLIFLHHNPMPSHIAPMDQIRLLDDAPFREIVGRHAARSATSSSATATCRWPGARPACPAPRCAAPITRASRCSRSRSS